MELKSNWRCYVIIIVFATVTATSSSPSAHLDKVVVTGKLGDDAPSVIYVGVGRDVKLICDVGKMDSARGGNVTSPPVSWSFLQENKVIHKDLSSTCSKSKGELDEGHDDDTDKKKRNSKENEDSEGISGSKQPFSECKVNSDKDHSHLFLDLKHVIGGEFGEYVCHTGNMKSKNSTFVLKEKVTLKRRLGNGKIEKSVTLNEGSMLDLYCNATGLTDSHVVSWWKDDKNITKELKTHSGLFENFTQPKGSNSTDLAFNGIVNLEHRGEYFCQVDLKNNSNSDNEHNGISDMSSHYPVKFGTYVRVKESNRWKLPGYILLGEIIAITLFTVIINRLEKKSEEEPDGQYEDSDDEDEIQAAKNSNNGVHNNNSGRNGK